MRFWPFNPYVGWSQLETRNQDSIQEIGDWFGLGSFAREYFYFDL